MAKLTELRAELKREADPAKAKNSNWFFKTGKGHYGEGDKFLGVPVPKQRAIARIYKGLAITDALNLLKSPWHEERLTALFILVLKYQSAAPAVKKQIVNKYHKNRAFVNNWDLVDSSAPYILGDYLFGRTRGVLYRLARSPSVWDRRIAIISTSNFIRQGDYKDTLKIAKMLLKDKHDLIHKAVGWMLREVGKKDKQVLESFLESHASQMPRTMLRYSLEKLSPNKRKKYMKLKN